MAEASSAVWITAEEARQDPYWPECPLDDPALDALLASAQAQCAAFAPRLRAGAEVPEHYRLALVMQAHALYRSTIAGPGDQIGPDGITVTVWPMDRTVKALLRPNRPTRIR